MKQDAFEADEKTCVNEAFNIAMTELAERHPAAKQNARLMEGVVTAIVDLVSAGQRDPHELARYAVSRSHYIP